MTTRQQTSLSGAPHQQADRRGSVRLRRISGLIHLIYHMDAVPCVTHLVRSSRKHDVGCHQAVFDDHVHATESDPPSRPTHRQNPSGDTLLTFFRTALNETSLNSSTPPCLASPMQRSAHRNEHRHGGRERLRWTCPRCLPGWNR